MFDILVTSRTRRKLLGIFTLNPDRQFYLYELAREIKESAQATRAELALLTRANFIFCTGTGRQKRYQLNLHYPYLSEISSVVGKLKKSGYKEYQFTDYPRKELLEKNLNSVVSALIAKYKPEKIILFGSLAKDDVKEMTDIDLLIVKDTRKPYTDRIREVIGLCNYNVGIDFIIYNPQELAEMIKTQSFVRNEMIKKGKVIYEKAA
jgi:predicted nucleotidyltransferase